MDAERNTPVGHFMMSLISLSININLAVIGIDVADNDSICTHFIEKNIFPLVTDILDQMEHLDQMALKEDLSYKTVISHLKNDINFLDEIINDPEIQAKGQKSNRIFLQVKESLNKIFDYLTK